MKTLHYIVLVALAFVATISLSCTNLEIDDDTTPYTEIISAGVKIHINKMSKATGNATLLSYAVMDNGVRVHLGDGSGRGGFSVRYFVRESHDKAYWVDPENAVLAAPCRGEKVYLVHSEITYLPTGKTVQSDPKEIVLSATERK